MLNKCSADVHFTCRKAPTKVGLVLINYFLEHLPVSFWSQNKKTYSKQIVKKMNAAVERVTAVSTVIFWQVSIASNPLLY